MSEVLAASLHADHATLPGGHAAQHRRGFNERLTALWDTARPRSTATFSIVLVIHGLLNTFGIKLVALLNDISVWWHVVAVAVIVGSLIIVPSSHQSFSFVFTDTENRTGFTSMLYVVLLGLLLSQYTLTGYDASAHMSEETKDAARSAPRGIVTSIGVSVTAGWVLLLGLTFAIQDYAGELGSTTGVPPAQSFIDAVGFRGGLALLLIAIGAQFFCGMSSITANSRMIYAFSRDGALPASNFWHRINKRTRTPANSIWLAAGGAFILGLPYLWNPTAYAAVTSIAVIGLYIAYVAPVLLRLIVGDKCEKGPWHLGAWGRRLGVIAVAWVAFITVLFVLPQTGPLDQVSLSTSTTPSSPSGACSSSPVGGGCSALAPGSQAPASRERPRRWRRRALARNRLMRADAGAG